MRRSRPNVGYSLTSKDQGEGEEPLLPLRAISAEKGTAGLFDINGSGAFAGPSNYAEPATTLLARAGVVEEEDLNSGTAQWLSDCGLIPEDFDMDFGLLAPEDTVIIRPFGGEDDDILLQELRPRFVVMYEPNLAFIRRLEVRNPYNNPDRELIDISGVQKLQSRLGFAGVSDDLYELL